MHGISTAWKSKVIHDGKELLRELIETGIPGVELEYRVTANMFQQMKEILKSGEIKVLSVHNYFPHQILNKKLPVRNCSNCLSPFRVLHESCERNRLDLLTII